MLYEIGWAIIGVMALIIGHWVGRVSHWSSWQAPFASIIVIPLAIDLGFNVTLSVIAPLCLAGGFLVARWKY